MAPATEEQICALELVRIAALTAPDLPALRELHAPDYQLITPSGRSLSRDRYLHLIESGALRYQRWAPGEMAVRLAPNMAIVRYQVVLQLGTAEAPDTPGTPKHCWHTDSYEPRDGRWQAVWSQATEIQP